MPGSFIADDIQNIINEDEFASSAVIGAGPSTISGIFDNLYIEVNGVEGLAPTLNVSSADLATAALTRGVKLTIDSVEYKFVRPEPDGTGMTLLILEDF